MKTFFAASALVLLALLALSPVATGRSQVLSNVTVERGELGAAALSGVTGITGATAILTTTAQSALLAGMNGCVVDLILVRAGANFKRLQASQPIYLPLAANDVAVGAAAYKVYYPGAVAPTGCTVELAAFPTN